MGDTVYEIRVSDVVIHGVERKRNSRQGNPGWRFYTDHGVFAMETDAMLGYAVDSYTQGSLDDEQCPWVIGNPDEPKVTLLLTSYNKVCGLEYDGRRLS